MAKRKCCHKHLLKSLFSNTAGITLYHSLHHVPLFVKVYKSTGSLIVLNVLSLSLSLSLSLTVSFSPLEWHPVWLSPSCLLVSRSCPHCLGQTVSPGGREGERGRGKEKRGRRRGGEREKRERGKREGRERGIIIKSK